MLPSLENYNIPENTDIMTLICCGMILQMKDGSPFELMERIKLVWTTELPSQYFNPFVQDLIKTILSVIVGVRCVTTYFYVLSGLMVIYALRNTNAYKSMLIWLVVSGIKSVLMTFLETVTGLYVCSAFRKVQKACVEFFISKAIELIFSAYLWGCVMNKYMQFRRTAAMRVLAQMEKGEILALDQLYIQKPDNKLRKTRSLLDELTLTKTANLNYFEFRDVPQIIVHMCGNSEDLNKNSLIGQGMMLASVSDMGSFDDLKTSCSLGELGFTDLKSVEVLGLDDDQFLSPTEKALKFLKMTWSDVEKVRKSKSKLDVNIFEVEKEVWDQVAAIKPEVSPQKRPEVYLHCNNPDFKEVKAKTNARFIQNESSMSFIRSSYRQFFTNSFFKAKPKNVHNIISVGSEDRMLMSNLLDEESRATSAVRYPRKQSYASLYRRNFMSIVGSEVFDNAPNLKKITSLSTVPGYETVENLPELKKESTGPSTSHPSYEDDEPEKLVKTQQSDAKIIPNQSSPTVSFFEEHLYSTNMSIDLDPIKQANSLSESSSEEILNKGTPSLKPKTEETKTIKYTKKIEYKPQPLTVTEFIQMLYKVKPTNKRNRIIRIRRIGRKLAKLSSTNFDHPKPDTGCVLEEQFRRDQNDHGSNEKPKESVKRNKTDFNDDSKAKYKNKEYSKFLPKERKPFEKRYNDNRRSIDLARLYKFKKTFDEPISIFRRKSFICTKSKENLYGTRTSLEKIRNLLGRNMEVNEELINLILKKKFNERKTAYTTNKSHDELRRKGDLNPGTSITEQNSTKSDTVSWNDEEFSVSANEESKLTEPGNSNEKTFSNNEEPVENTKSGLEFEGAMVENVENSDTDEQLNNLSEEKGKKEKELDPVQSEEDNDNSDKNQNGKHIKQVMYFQQLLQRPFLQVIKSYYDLQKKVHENENGENHNGIGDSLIVRNDVMKDSLRKKGILQLAKISSKPSQEINKKTWKSRALKCALTDTQNKDSLITSEPFNEDNVHYGRLILKRKKIIRNIFVKYFASHLDEIKKKGEPEIISAQFSEKKNFEGNIEVETNTSLLHLSGTSSQGSDHSIQVLKEIVQEDEVVSTSSISIPKSELPSQHISVFNLKRSYKSVPMLCDGPIKSIKCEPKPGNLNFCSSWLSLEDSEGSEIRHIDFLGSKTSDKDISNVSRSDSPEPKYATQRKNLKPDVKESTLMKHRKKSIFIRTPSKSPKKIASSGQRSQKSDESFSLYYSKAADLTSPLLDTKTFIYPDHIHYSYKHVKKKGFDVDSGNLPLLVTGSITTNDSQKAKQESTNNNSAESKITKRPMDLSFTLTKTFADWQSKEQNDSDPTIITAEAKMSQYKIDGPSNTSKKNEKPTTPRFKCRKQKPSEIPSSKKGPSIFTNLKQSRIQTPLHNFFKARLLKMQKEEQHIEKVKVRTPEEHQKKVKQERTPVQISSSQLHSNKGRINSTYNPAISLHENKTRNERKKLETPEEKTKDMFVRLQRELLLLKRSGAKPFGPYRKKQL